MKPLVLIVDDEVAIVTMLRYNLEKEGFAVCEAADGEEARSEEHTSELQSHSDLVCRLLLEKKKIISMMGCYYGLRSEGGAEGVGVATTHAVVASCLLMLIVDYLLASLLLRVLSV